jgi:hypothetical protein
VATDSGATASPSVAQTAVWAEDILRTTCEDLSRVEHLQVGLLPATCSTDAKPLRQPTLLESQGSVNTDAVMAAGSLCQRTFRSGPTAASILGLCYSHSSHVDSDRGRWCSMLQALVKP